MSKFKLVSIRINEQEQEDIREFKNKNNIDIAVLIRDIIKDITLQEYNEIQKILIEIDKKYPQKISLSNKSNIRNKSLKLRLDAFVGDIFRDICEKNGLSYTSIIRGILFDEVYK